MIHCNIDNPCQSQTGEMKGIENGTEELNLLLFADDMTIYKKTPRTIPPKIIETNNLLQLTSKIQNSHKNIISSITT
jgi:hypothetical protein